MKKHLALPAATIWCLTAVLAFGQPGPRGGGMGGGMGGPVPQMSASMAKLFGKNAAYTAEVETQVKPPQQEQTMTIPGKIAHDSGKSRFEVDINNAKGMSLPPDFMARIKSMGMDKTIYLSRPDKNISYIIYPTLNAYAEMPSQEVSPAKLESDFKLSETKLGEETVDGHPAIKNKAVVTDDKGVTHEFTVWNAKDLKGFPVKIETKDPVGVSLLFKNVKLAKPDAAQFEPPANMKRHDNIQSLLQEQIMKQMGESGGGTAPSGQ